ncbi:unnamed protein product [Closterium sp. NIES-65]|nr:unnamed protein product [Closterium sp. NIES-65]
MLRTTPASTLSAREWREWSETLLGTALTAAKLRIPTSELEQSLLWRQGTLPIRLGGLGVIDPIYEAPAAYLASVTAAHILLRQLNLPTDCLLSRASQLLSHEWAPLPPETNPRATMEALHQGCPARGRSREDSAASPSLQPPPQSAQRATSHQPPSLVVPNTREAGPVRTTAASNTSPRAQRAARRGEAARLQEQQQEEQAGQEGLAAQEEPAADAVEAGAEETDLRGDVAAAGSGLTRRGEQGAAAEADLTGTGREAHSPAAVPIAASHDDSTAPAAGPMAPPADEVNGSEFIPSHSEASEDLVSLGDDENQHVSAQVRVRRTEQGGMPQPPNMPAGQAPAVPPQPSEKSPADLAKDESF